MSDVHNNIVWTLKDNVSAGTAKLNKQLDSIGVKSKGATGLLGKLGVATGGLITPMSLGASGALALAGGLVYAGKAAIEEEKNIAKLDAALKANVEGFDGNTASIEKAIAQREKLAFSDDELRDSLALLVGATHDVDKAMTIQATAMDLARFKGISLQEASEALTKVQAGSYRVLKSLGIVLKDGATQTEALAAVQKVAGGQAKAYGDTTAGAMEAASIAIDDVVEDIGSALLPIVKDLAITMRDDVIPTLRDAGAVMSDVGGTGVGLGDVLQGVIDSFNPMGEAADQMADDMRDAIERVKNETEGMRRTSGADLGLTEDAWVDLGDEAGTSARDIKDAAEKAQRSVKGMRTSIVSDAQGIVEGAYDILDARAGLSAANAQISAAKRVLASGTASKAEKRDAKETLREAGEDQKTYLLKLGQAGESGTRLVKDTLVQLKKDLKTATGQERIAIEATIDAFERLEEAARQARAQVRLTNKAMSDAGLRYGGGGGTALAHGGPALPNRTYTVGEEGPETLVMGSSGGWVIPNAGGGGGGGDSGGVNVIQLVVDGRVLAEVVDKYQYRELQRAAPTILRA